MVVKHQSYKDNEGDGEIQKARKYRGYARWVGDRQTVKGILALAAELRDRARALAHPDEGKIRNRAREIWEENGKPQGRDLMQSRVGRCASYAQQRALHKRSLHCQYPGCTASRELQAHHIVADEHGGKTELDNLILLCPRHHKHLHDHHIHTSGTGQHPAFTDATARAITTNQPHAPPR